jgi:hypothetical protein
MADTNYDYNNNHYNHFRNDVRDAHTNSSVARMLATLALIGALIALGVSIAAWNKANDAAGRAQNALDNSHNTTQQQ